jgi:hypothetical protein
LANPTKTEDKMRLRLAMLLAYAVAAPLALAGGPSPGDTQPPSVLSSMY